MPISNSNRSLASTSPAPNCFHCLRVNRLSLLTSWQSSSDAGGCLNEAEEFALATKDDGGGDWRRTAWAAVKLRLRVKVRAVELKPFTDTAVSRIEIWISSSPNAKFGINHCQSQLPSNVEDAFEFCGVSPDFVSIGSRATVWCEKSQMTETLLMRRRNIGETDFAGDWQLKLSGLSLVLTNESDSSVRWRRRRKAGKLGNKTRIRRVMDWTPHSDALVAMATGVLTGLVAFAIFAGFVSHFVNVSLAEIEEAKRDPEKRKDKKRRSYGEGDFQTMVNWLRGKQLHW